VVPASAAPPAVDTSWVAPDRPAGASLVLGVVPGAIALGVGAVSAFMVNPSSRVDEQCSLRTMAVANAVRQEHSSSRTSFVDWR
jgi:hypothetical protein